MTAAMTLWMSTVLIAGASVVALTQSGSAQPGGGAFAVADEVAASVASICPDGRVTFAGYVLAVGDALGRFDAVDSASALGACR